MEPEQSTGQHLPGITAGLATAEPSLPAEPEHHRFEFRGRAGEYFRIWIVNVALSVLTLGVFSAWAKVRRERWFYGNTWVAGAPFEYLAQPLPILKGRAVAGLILVAYVGVGQVAPLAQPVLLIALGIATPWLVQKGLRFRARYSGWRSLNFSFTGDPNDAYTAYLFRPMALIPTLGLAYPWIRHGQSRYTVEGHRFGEENVGFGAPTGSFYRVYGKVSLLVILLLVVVIVLVVLLSAGLAATNIFASMDPQKAGLISGIAGVAAVYTALIAGWVLASTRITNLTFNSASIAGHRFRSSLRARDVLGLYFTNTLAVLASAGLLVPWARVRMARYRARHLALLAAGPPDAFRSSERRQQGAAGAETADIMDVDFSL